ncbi:hypothetical protein [Aliivibrio fischeri]|uniref:hypothetical protein n=1 Tax=Aliivibrio fischeri TaxID=668 RepID=UPI00105ECC80|nr:hypothetical protein [Aliivibrio fischeri]TDM51935.1 hypothetical protein VFFQA001_17690 [Aliivibrio fischeri]
MKNKLTLTLMELQGIPAEKGNNLTLAILTHSDIDSFDALFRNLKNRYFPNAEIYFSVSSDEIYLRGEDRNVSIKNEYHKIKECIDNMTKGVEILVCDRNLGFAEDFPVFDNADELDLTKKDKSPSWILISDESSLGDLYDECPESITFKVGGDSNNVRTITYCKKEEKPILTSIVTAAHLIYSNESAYREQLHDLPPSKEYAESELKHLVNSLQS